MVHQEVEREGRQEVLEEGSKVELSSDTVEWRLEPRVHRYLHSLAWEINWCVCVLVTQSCLTLCNPTDYSPPGFSVHGVHQARTLE